MDIERVKAEMRAAGATNVGGPHGVFPMHDRYGTKGEYGRSDCDHCYIKRHYKV